MQKFPTTHEFDINEFNAKIFDKFDEFDNYKALDLIKFFRESSAHILNEAFLSFHFSSPPLPICSS